MHLRLTDLFEALRQGPLLIERHEEIRQLAADVHPSGTQYKAPDATHALAWLLWTRHNFACVRESLTQIDVPVFRGQNAEYKTVRSGTGREGTEATSANKINWFGVLLCAWLEARVPPPRDRHGVGPAEFALAYEERLYIAQHYGNDLEIRTPLLDWTFDPLVAFVFAARNKEGRVLINSRSLSTQSYLVLPPLNISRPWRQKAVHGWNTDFAVGALECVVFSVGETERQVIERHYDALLPKDSISEIARIALRQDGTACPQSLVWFPSFADLKAFDPALAEELSTVSPQPVREKLFFDYVDSVCVKSFSGRTSYDVLPLCALLRNAFWVGDLLASQGPKVRFMRKIWREPDYRWAISSAVGRYEHVQLDASSQEPQS